MQNIRNEPCMNEKSNALSGENLTLLRGNAPIVTDFSFSLQGGEMAWLQGKSGSGKSSLLLAIARLISLKAGELYYNAQSSKSIPITQWRTSVHYVAQRPILLSDAMGAQSIEKELSFADSFKVRTGKNQKQDTQKSQKSQKSLEEKTAKQEKMRGLLQKIGLDLSLDSSAKELSGGQLARLCLVRSLLIEPTVLLLDEPTAFLDADNSIFVYQLMLRFVKQGGMLIFTEHKPVLPEILNQSITQKWEIGHGS